MVMEYSDINCEPRSTTEVDECDNAERLDIAADPASEYAEFANQNFRYTNIRIGTSIAEPFK
jgi:hypothetical protein